MKTIATLALIMALLGFPAGNANADTFTLWDFFPPSANGQNGHYTAGVTYSGEVLTLLNNTAPYYFSRDGVVVARSANQPLILMQPSYLETAVLLGAPEQEETDSLHVTGQFTWVVGTMHVNIGTADITDPFNPVFTSLLNDGHGDTLNEDNQTVTFDLTGVIVDHTHALVFAVDDEVRETGLTHQAYLQGTIDATPIPVPGSLLLLGSGLLGLAGWRRRPWSK